jgi:GDP/UDP-N,N'-diacetylbacillosamine 2-epimerase (hydrolysing)
MKKIAIVTSTRAEYGVLSPLIELIAEDTDFSLDLIVTGGHLCESQGYTISEIQADGYSISHVIPSIEEDNSALGISNSIANTIKGFAECFSKDRPDIVIILGDRTEILGVAIAAMNERIPLAHIHGGEVTEGAVDDGVRHSLTKMSYLHFTSTEKYRRRVIQLGENPSRVFNVGSLSSDNILNMHLMSEEELRKEIGIPTGVPFVVVTFHPVTLEDNSIGNQVKELICAMKSEREFFYLITKSNTDAGGKISNEELGRFCDSCHNAKLVSSLGKLRYLSAVKYAVFVLGNSSSGIGEAPVIGTPTVNIGDRQKGREMAETIVSCLPNKDSIIDAMNIAKTMPHVSSKMYGDGKTAQKIVSVLKDYLCKKKINLKKGFYDVSFDK